jgi:hypothetical protein
LWPDGRFQHLKHIFWNLHWEHFFTPPLGAGKPWGKNRVVTVEQYPVVGSVKDGAPTDNWAKKVLTAADAPNCLDLGAHQSKNPVMTWSDHWSDFLSELTVPKP